MKVLPKHHQMTWPRYFSDDNGRHVCQTCFHGNHVYSQIVVNTTDTSMKHDLHDCQSNFKVILLVHVLLIGFTNIRSNLNTITITTAVKNCMLGSFFIASLFAITLRGKNSGNQLNIPSEYVLGSVPIS